MATATHALPGEARELRRLVVRALVVVAVVLGVLAFLSARYRTQLDAIARWFVGTLGLTGAVAGSALADGLHVPIPPQVYLFLAIAGGTPAWAAIAAVYAGAVVGGTIAFALGRALGDRPGVQRRLEAPRRWMDRVLAARPIVVVVLAIVLPVSYCLMCVAAGAQRLERRKFLILLALRLPRLLLAYALVALGWG